MVNRGRGAAQSIHLESITEFAVSRLSPDRRHHDTPLVRSAYGDRIAAYSGGGT